jgi:hypothetical protein
MDGIGAWIYSSCEMATATQDWKVWAAIWRTEAACLEGSCINGVKAGEVERLAAVETVRNGFEDGNDKTVLFSTIDAMERGLAEVQSSGDARKTVVRVEALDAPRLRSWQHYVSG